MIKYSTTLVILLFSLITLRAQTLEIYGLTSQGGANSKGTLFKTDANGDNHTVIRSFAGTDGEMPDNDLIQASNGNLYGMTLIGGTSNAGVLFEYDPVNDIYAKKFEFTGGLDGGYPESGLLEASNGKLYGMTNGGGANNKGIIFEYDPATSVMTKKLDFDGANNGSYPYGSLMEYSNGKLYGMASRGGTSDNGVLFEYDPATDTYTKKIDFDGAVMGSWPNAALEEASNGKLYGMTPSGGANSDGVLFEYDPATNTYLKKLDFSNAIGRSPMGSLIEATNGKLYGLLRFGGPVNLAVLFEYDYVGDVYTHKQSFTSFGANPESSMMKASNGKLYGAAFMGGAFSQGTIFEYDYVANAAVTKFDFNGTDGSRPKYGSLLEASVCYNSANSISITACDSYSVPSGDETYTAVGTYPVMDTIANSCGSDSVMTITVTILPQLTGTHNETVCFGGSIVVNGTTYDAINLTGTEVFTNVGPNNCDSTVTVNLTILPQLTGTHNETLCFGGSIVVNGTTYDANNLTGTEVFTNIGSNNCDSTVTVNLTILPQLTGTHNETLCFGESIVVNGTTYDANNLTGTEVFTNIGSNNCDSTVSVSLTISPSIDVTVAAAGSSVTANQTGATYKWLDCNNNNAVITGATGITYTASTNGDYAVEITLNNCVDTSVCVTILTVGINENMLFKNVSIYPNPNLGNVNIDLGSLKDVSVKIFNTNGQLIYSKGNINTPIFQFELNTSAGIYFVEIDSNNKTQKYKLIIE